MAEEMETLKELERKQDRLIELKEEEARIENEKDNKFAAEYQALRELWGREVVAHPVLAPTSTGAFEIRLQYSVNRIR